MRIRATSCALALALGALAPSSARALGWTGRLGFEFGRDDQWNPAGERADAQRLDLNAGLEAAGVLGRGTLRWSGGAEYRRLSLGASGVDAVQENLGYRLQSRLFTDPRSPFSLDLDAQRSEDEVAAPGVSAVDRSTTTSYGALARLQAPHRPFLHLGYRHDEVEREGPVVGLAMRTNDQISVSTGFGGNAFTYTGRYRGTFSEGDFVTDNRDDHRADVGVSVEVSPELDLRISDTFYLRIPTATSTLNPRQEQHVFSASLQQGAAVRTAQGITYQYVRAFQEAPSGDLERESQRLGYSIQRPLPDPAWRIRGSADLTLATGRVGPTETRATGQTLGTTVSWRGPAGGLDLEVRAGPTVGLLQPEGGDLEYGYGATAGTTLRRTWGTLQTQLAYDATYRSDLGSEGWSVQQQLVAGASGRMGLAGVSGQLIGSAQRSYSPLFGDGASRSLSALGSYARGRYQGELRVGLTQGISGDAGESIASDGLFLPAPYNSRVLFATLTASARISTYLSFRGLLRTTSSDLPDRPTLDEHEGRAALHFQYGALGFSIENRYIVTETVSGTGKLNQVWLRAYRIFGSRF